MNKISKLTLLAAVLIPLSCSGWLDIPVEALEPADAVDYSDPAGADNLLAGCYSVVSSSRSAGSWAILAVTAVRGDDTEKGNPSPADQAVLTEFHEFNYDNASSFWALGNAWNDQYWVIVKLNAAIDALQKYKAAGADAARMDEYVAQVRVLRAYTYFRIARLFGAMSRARINVRMIDQGSSELSIIVGVNDSDFEATIHAIYHEFVG